MNRNLPILVTGSTGYVGGRLVSKLLAEGYRVRAMGRSMEKLAARKWACHPNVELVQGDVLDRRALVQHAKGCSAAYYLVHAMIAQKKRFAQADRHSAQNMINAASAAGLEQIIYLGGLGDSRHPNLTRHLASRHEVGTILQSGQVPVTVLRAAMIIGSGSASFEILRYLVERLPIMITPKWVHTPTQPIAIANVLDYLVGCLGNPQTYSQTFDIGGPDVLRYQTLIEIYARMARLPSRTLLPVPVLTPKLSAHWIHLVTPVPGAIALPLTEGLSLPTTCRENRIHDIVPVNLLSCEHAIGLALDQILEKQVETCWSDAGELQPFEWAVCGDAAYAGGTLLSCAYSMKIQAPANQVWKPIVSIGGNNGYYFGDMLWRLRGLMDRLAGGVGLRRGRRHPSDIDIGDALDFWRVLSLAPNKRFTLMAEMKVPGEAILDIQLHVIDAHTTELQMISRFLPRGLGGILYWYSLLPFHVMIFKGMLIALAERVGASYTHSPKRLDIASAEATGCAWPLNIRRP